MKNQFQYKAWANREILDTLRKTDPGINPEKHKLAIRLLNHALVVDKIFSAHLANTKHGYSATNTVETPSVEDLAAAITDADNWLENYVSALSPAEIDEKISFPFTDGDTGCMTRGEILFHLLAHGAYHRGNVGMLLSDCGADRPKDTFTRYLHWAEPARRSQT